MGDGNGVPGQEQELGYTGKTGRTCSLCVCSCMRPHTTSPGAKQVVVSGREARLGTWSGLVWSL